jgi:RNA-binding protein YhbY
MPINSKQRKALKTKAHHLKPVIRIGQHGKVSSLKPTLP